MDQAVRVFVGCAPDALDAESQMVVEHSLRSRSSLPVDITWMRLTRDPLSPWYADGKKRGWPVQAWTTPFTLFRWAIPEVCGFQGKAIYCDSDVLFRADVAELWNTPIEPGKVFVAKGSGRSCVSLWDCAEAKLHLPTVKRIKRDWVDRCRAAKEWRESIWQKFAKDQNWNCIDGDGVPLDDTIKCIHYSDIATQPHMKEARARLAYEGREHWYDGPLATHGRQDLVDLFTEELEAAFATGLSPERYAQSPPYGRIKKRDLKEGYKGGSRRAQA